MIDFRRFAIDLFSNDDLTPVYGPVDEETIAAAEKEIGTVFPSSYREFLSLFGAAYHKALCIYGLPDSRDTEEEIHFFHNVVDQTLGRRGLPLALNTMANNLILFAEDGGGVSLYFDTTQVDPHGEYLVVTLGNDNLPNYYASNFFEAVSNYARMDESFAEKSVGATIIPSAEGDKLRGIDWIQLIPEPCPPGLSELAQHFGVDASADDVFVYGPSTGLSVEEQAETVAIGQGFFANPVKKDKLEYPYLSLNHVIASAQAKNQADIYKQLKKFVFERYNQS